ncbi:MAG TPA: proline dehydrogenase family protein [Vicinamibacterales bacterium]
MLDSASKTFFHLIARSQTLKKVASRYGMRDPSSFARRFIAGETVAEAIEAARTVEGRGMTVTMDLLGESVTSLATADVATRGYIDVIDAMVASGVGRNISLKLTQLGLDVDKASAIDNLRKILERAEPAGFFVRVDMENSPYTDVTLAIYETLWRHGYHHLGVVLQSALYRSEKDLAAINAFGGRVRLVKGAYKESKTVAYPKKADVDAAYARMLKTLITGGNDPAIATHDPAMIELARTIAREEGIAPDRFEFQMLYGIRRDLQTMLVKAGYRVRIYIPFGREWFPYFMRRLGERPANVLFVLRGILGDRG